MSGIDYDAIEALRDKIQAAVDEAKEAGFALETFAEVPPVRDDIYVPVTIQIGKAQGTKDALILRQTDNMGINVVVLDIQAIPDIVTKMLDAIKSDETIN